MKFLLRWVKRQKALRNADYLKFRAEWEQKWLDAPKTASKFRV